jgi:hypothetical protein
MMSRKRVVILASALAAAFAFAVAPSLFARGGGGAGGSAGGGNRGDTGGGLGDQPDDGSEPPPEEQTGSPGGTTTKGADKTGGIDFGGDGAAQKDIAGDVFAGMARDAFRRLRDERNRLASDPSSARR